MVRNGAEHPHHDAVALQYLDRTSGSLFHSITSNARSSLGKEAGATFLQAVESVGFRIYESVPIRYLLQRQHLPRTLGLAGCATRETQIVSRTAVTRRTPEPGFRSLCRQNGGIS